MRGTNVWYVWCSHDGAPDVSSPYPPNPFRNRNMPMRTQQTKTNMICKNSTISPRRNITPFAGTKLPTKPHSERERPTTSTRSLERFTTLQLCPPHEIPARVSSGYKSSITEVSDEYHPDITRKVDIVNSPGLRVVRDGRRRSNSRVDQRSWRSNNSHAQPRPERKNSHQADWSSTTVEMDQKGPASKYKSPMHDGTLMRARCHVSYLGWVKWIISAL
jgi:hypothetical protein